MIEFCYILGIVVTGVLLGAGLILGWYWLIAIGFVVLPIAAIWGLVAAGPGSSANPYRQH